MLRSLDCPTSSAPNSSVVVETAQLGSASAEPTQTTWPQLVPASMV